MAEDKLILTADTALYQRETDRARATQEGWNATLGKGNSLLAELDAATKKAADSAKDHARKVRELKEEWDRAERARSAGEQGRDAKGRFTKQGTSPKETAADADKATTSLKGMGNASAGASEALARLVATGAKLAGIAGLAVGVAVAIKKGADVYSEAAIKADRASKYLQVSIEGASIALGGVVDDLTLATMANKAFQLGVVKSGAELTVLAAGVNVLAQKLGEDAGQLFDNAVTAIGRQSALILDNLGIILNQTQAQEIYAQHLGKTTKQLDANERAHAFAFAATMKIAGAAKEAAKTSAAASVAYQQFKTEMVNFTAKAVGFSDRIGKARDGIRSLDDSQLRLVLSTKYHGAAIGEVNDALEQQAIEQAALIKETTGMDIPMETFLVNLEDLKYAADELGLSLEQLIQKELDLRKAQEAENIEKENVRKAAERAAATKKAKSEEADELDHQIELMRIAGVEEKDLVASQIESLQLRQAAALAAKHEAGAIEESLGYARQIELLQAKLDSGGFDKKKGGGGRNIAQELRDLEREAAEFRLAAAAQIQEFEIEAARSLTSQLAQTERLVELQQRQVELRRRYAEAMPEATRLQRAAKEQELAKIELDQEVLRRESITATRDIEAAAFQVRIDELDREIERNKLLKAETALLEAQRARLAEEQVIRFGTMEEHAAFLHESEMTRIRQQREELLKKHDEERMLYDQRLEIEQAWGNNVVELADARFELELRQAKAEKDHDKVRDILHRRDVARIKDAVKKREVALQASSQLMQIGAQTGAAFVDAAIKDDAKRERANLRMQGMLSLGIAALETVKAVASFAGQNYLEGAMHVAAAALAGITGTMMLAGKVPGGSAGGASAAANEGPSIDIGTGDSKRRGKAEAPISSDELDDARGGRQRPREAKPAGGDTINFNVGIQIGGDQSYQLQQVDTAKKKAWG